MVTGERDLLFSLALVLLVIVAILLSGCADIHSWPGRVEQPCSYPEWTAAPTVCCYGPVAGCFI